jgi:hypothetical protein
VPAVRAGRRWVAPSTSADAARGGLPHASSPLSSHSGRAAPCWWLDTLALRLAAALERRRDGHVPGAAALPRPTPSLDSQNRSRWPARSAISARKRARRGRAGNGPAWRYEEHAEGCVRGAATPGEDGEGISANRVGGSRALRRAPAAAGRRAPGAPARPGRAAASPVGRRPGWGADVNADAGGTAAAAWIGGSIAHAARR